MSDDRLYDAIDMHEGHMENMMSDLRWENAKLRAALEVIADDKNWSCDTDINDNYHEEWVCREFVREIAKQALPSQGGRR